MWRRLLPATELWEAEVDGKCIDAHRAELRRLGIHPLVGDQADPATLRSWLDESGGGFDAVIDDRGHTNEQILASFKSLWPQVKPGGIYFMEDLQLGRQAGVQEYERVVVSDVIQAWIELLLVDAQSGKSKIPVRWDANAANKHALAARTQHPLPQDLAFIYCQHEACALGKTRGPPLPTVQLPQPMAARQRAHKWSGQGAASQRSPVPPPAHERIPLLGIAVNADPRRLLHRLLLSLDAPVDEFVIVHGQDDPIVEQEIAAFIRQHAKTAMRLTVLRYPGYLGCAEGWNAVFTAVPTAPWGVFAASDTEFMPGALSTMAREFWPLAQRGAAVAAGVGWDNPDLPPGGWGAWALFLGDKGRRDRQRTPAESCH